MTHDDLIHCYTRDPEFRGRGFWIARWPNGVTFFLTDSPQVRPSLIQWYGREPLTLKVFNPTRAEEILQSFRDPAAKAWVECDPY